MTVIKKSNADCLLTLFLYIWLYLIKSNTNDIILKICYKLQQINIIFFTTALGVIYVNVMDIVADKYKFKIQKGKIFRDIKNKCIIYFISKVHLINCQ